MIIPLLKLFLGLLLVVYCTIQEIMLFLIPKWLRYKDISGETVLITGAGSGIGSQLALEFAKHVSKLVLLDINKKGLKETRELIARKSYKNVDVFLYECDVSNRDVIYSVAAKIKDEVGAVTILVNNAGILTGKMFLDCPDTMIQKTMEVNVMAHFWTCKAFLPDMKANNHGHIVTVASLAGFVPAVPLIDYCASKHAAVGFEASLRLELEQEGFTGIKTTLIAPYFVQTGLIEKLDSSFMFALTTEWVAKQILSGVLADQEVVFMPQLSYILTVAIALLPRKAFRQLYNVIITFSIQKKNQGKKIS